MKRDLEHAAVGQLEAGADAQLGKPQRLARVRCDDANACGFEVIAHRLAASDPYAADEHLGQRQWMDEHRSWRGVSRISVAAA